jgi:diguanylate cyclase (GGDEF)-like protein
MADTVKSGYRSGRRAAGRIFRECPGAGRLRKAAKRPAPCAGEKKIDPMKVLIAEDEPVSRRLLESKLKAWGYEVTSTKDGNAALELLTEEDGPRLALLDWVMPNMDGLEVCRRLRLQTDRPYVYVVLLTSKNRREEFLEGMNAGADDYLTKPFDIYELKVRLQVGRRILELQQALLEAQHALMIQATRDSLTGLYNRRRILELVEQELNRCRRHNLTLAVILADIDHFKSVNDTYGHLTGDEVLREIARRLTDCVRSHERVGRYGGEEFLIVLSVEPDAAHAGAERIRQCVCRDPVETPQGGIPITISFGMVLSDPSDRKSVESFLSSADDALYLAKEKGRNRTETAS